MSMQPILVNHKGLEQPYIALTDNKGGPAKLRLGLRKLAFQEELAKKDLPKDAKALLELALQQRQRGLEFKYEMVFIFTKLQTSGRYWGRLGFTSIDHMLAYLDLPNGAILGTWEVLVRLVDRETFILVGDEVLGYMVSCVSKCQRILEERRRDYKAIFESYCKSYDSFDKTAFLKKLQKYLETTYPAVTASPKPRATAPAPTATDYSFSDNLHRARLRAISREKNPPPPSAAECGNCKTHHKRFLEALQAVQAANTHITRLETIIKDNLGAACVPQRPQVLRMIGINYSQFH